MNYWDGPSEADIKRWTQNWKADSFIRHAVVQAYIQGRQDMWQEILKMKESIIEKEEALAKIQTDSELESAGDANK